MNTESSPGPDAPFRSPPARGGPLSGPIGVVVIVLALGAAAYLTYRLFSSPAPEPPRGLARDFLCAETNQHFRYALKSGEDIPVESPFSKKKTGYPAEACYCVINGKPSAEPTWVVLNEHLGKPGPTHCPRCGAEVVGHNIERLAERPLPDAAPPPETRPADAIP